MTTALVCTPPSPSSSTLAPNFRENTEHRIKLPDYGIVAGHNLTESQRAQAVKDRAKGKRTHDAVDGWARVHGHTELNDKLKRCLRNLEKASFSNLLLCDGGWLPTSDAPKWLGFKGGTRQRYSQKTAMRVLNALIAANLAEHKKGFVRLPRADSESVESKSRYGQICPYGSPQKNAYNASLAINDVLHSNKGDAAGEPLAHGKPRRERDALGRFLATDKKNNQQKAVDDLWQSWKPRAQNGPIPPCPLTPEEIDDVEADIRSREDCLRRRQEDSRTRSRRAAPTPYSHKVGCNRLSEGLAATPSQPAQAQPSAPLQAPVGTLTDRSSSAVELALPKGLAAEFAAAFAAFQAKAVPERPDDDKPDPWPDRGPGPDPKKPFKQPLPAPTPPNPKNVARFTSLAWRPVERGGSVSAAWLRDVFGGTRYDGLSFAAIRALHLDCNSLLAARALCDGRKGIAENWPGMLVAAAKRLQQGQWLMLGEAREPCRRAAPPLQGRPQGRSPA